MGTLTVAEIASKSNKVTEEAEGTGLLTTEDKKVGRSVSFMRRIMRGVVVRCDGNDGKVREGKEGQR